MASTKNTQKKVLITGANKGIGFEIARQLGTEGHHIFLSARNEDRGTKAQQQLKKTGIKSSFIPLDVGDKESITQAFDLIKQETDHLDVLIHNAGILLDEGHSIFSVPEAFIEDTIRINALGPLFITRTFRSLLKPGSRVVLLSSGAGQICGGMKPWAPIYSSSKTLLNAITMQLAHALKEADIPVNAMCPGWVRTDMGGVGANRSVGKGAETAVWLATEASSQLTGKFWRDKEEINW